MADLNANIILGGRPVNTLAAFGQGLGTANMQNEMQRKNQLQQLMQQHGAGIMQGDPNALNALAGVDPKAALGIMGQRQGLEAGELGMDATRLNMAATNQRISVVNEQEKRAVAEYKAKVGAQQAAAEAAKLENGIKGAAVFHQRGDRVGYENFLRSNGLDPTQYPFDDFPAHAAKFMSMADLLKRPEPDYVTMGGQMVNRNAQGGPAVVPVQGLKPEGPEWRPATPEEALSYGYKSGQINVKTGKFDGTPLPKGTRIVSDGNGGFTFEEGVGIGGAKPPKTTEGEKSSAGYLSRMRASESLLDELSGDGEAVRSITSLIVGGTNFEGIALGERQGRILQAQRDWVRAKLRKESGAVIGADEMAEEVRTYFPLPGEGPEVIAQKRQARKAAERQFEIMSGGAAEPVNGEQEGAPDISGPDPLGIFE